ncbi:hypothetical protein MASR2M47_27250 [Draconibacterium sp.]
MSIEDKNKDYKSLKKAIGAKANHRDLAETCVCFANAQGGEIIIGIEDKEDTPPATQKVNQDEVNKLIKSLRSLTDGVGIVNPEIFTAQKWRRIFYLTDFTFYKNHCNYFFGQSIYKDYRQLLSCG